MPGTLGAPLKLDHAELFESAFRHAPIGMALVGLDGRFLKANDSLLQIIGYDREEVLTLDFQRITHPDDLADDLAWVNRMIAGDVETYRMDKRYIRKDGGVVWCSLSVSLAYTRAGKPSYFVSQVEDLTARLTAEEAMRASEARYRMLAENGTDLIVRSGLDGVVEYCSPAIRALGWEPEDIIGQPRSKSIHPEDYALAKDILDRVAQGEAGGRGYDIRLLTKTGEPVWYEAAPSLVRGPGGEPIGFVNSLRNVTTRRAIEEELRIAKAEAEAATAVKSEFLANMSHEIRTPLTAIVGFTGLLKGRQELSETARGHVDRVEAAGKALLSIVNDVLDFSKLEAGRFEIAPQVASPLDEAQSTVLMFAPMADAKGLALDFRSEGPIPAYARFDPDRLRQILLNLVSNAMKFTAQGAVRIGMRFDSGAEALHVFVEDTGPGMSDEQQGKLFQRFSQVDASSTRLHSGTGLGLAICKGLAEAMGGQISVSSTVGVGSTFAFHIRAPIVEDKDIDPNGSEEVAAVGAPGVRVLVVDDNPINRELARVTLELAGAEVSEADGGEAALAAAAQMPYDVVLLDIRMPGMNGPAVLEALRRSDGPNSFIPVVAFTADADLGRFADGAHGFDDVVSKPIDPTALIRTVLYWANAQSDRESKEQDVA